VGRLASVGPFSITLDDALRFESVPLALILIHIYKAFCYLSDKVELL
jgi:hypothetical protein